MGTYRNFSLNVVKLDGSPLFCDEATEVEEKVMASLRIINPNYFSDCFSFSEAFSDEIKWYQHEDDMIVLSRVFPNLVFSLESYVVDEPLTNQVEYYHNGVEEICKLVYHYEKPRSSFGKVGEVYL